MAKQRKERGRELEEAMEEEPREDPREGRAYMAEGDPAITGEAYLAITTEVGEDEEPGESSMAGESCMEFSHSTLSQVRTPESELVQQELTAKSIINSVTTFDSTSPLSTTTTKQTLFPDTATTQTEQDRQSLLKSVESEHSVSPVLPGMATIQKTHVQHLAGIDESR